MAIVAPKATAMISARRDRLLVPDRKSTRLNSSHLGISYAVFFLKKKNQQSLAPTPYENHDFINRNYALVSQDTLCVCVHGTAGRVMHNSWHVKLRRADVSYLRVC